MNKAAVLLCALLCVVLPVSAQVTTPDGSVVPPPGQQVGRNSTGFGPYPAPDSGYVTDNVGLLSQSEEEQIEQWLWRVETETGVEVAVVTIGSVRDYPGAAGPTIESFATGLFDAYGIGNLPENDGVLLLIARDDRKARIELGAGYNPARDRDAARIMAQDIIPHFKSGSYAGGITAGVRAIMLEFAGVRVGTNWPLIVLLAAIPVTALIAFSLFRSGKRGWGWIVVGLLVVLSLAIMSVLITVARSTSNGSSRGWSSGGAGGGFGGGFSGGGGATGSW